MIEFKKFSFLDIKPLQRSRYLKMTKIVFSLTLEKHPTSSLQYQDFDLRLKFLQK